MKPWKGQPTPAEFWAFTARSGDCLLWKGSVIAQSNGTPGYGYCWWRGRRDRAHRVAFELGTGTPAPSKESGLVIMHSCDTPLCVNPAHLRVGSPRDNAIDMSNKGRAAGGGNNTHLNEDIVRAARRLDALGFKRKVLAERLGLTRLAVQKMMTGLTWQHVEADPMPSAPRRQSQSARIDAHLRLLQESLADFERAVASPPALQSTPVS